MRRFLILFFILLTMAPTGSAVATCATTACRRSTPEQQDTSYPGIHAWTAINDSTATACLVRLVRKYNRRLAISETLVLIDAIYTAAIVHDLDPLFVASVIAAESSFNPRARSCCGAEGLMQLTRPIQPWLGVKDPFDIKENVAGGCQYLTYLRRRFDRPELVLAAYNAGPGRVARLGRVPEIPETVGYVHRVTKLHARLAAEVRGAFTVATGGGPFDPFG